MDAFFAPPVFNIERIMQQEVARVLAAFQPCEEWVAGDVLVHRLNPARNNGIRAQLTAIERACRSGRLLAAQRRPHPRSPERIVCYSRIVA